MRKKAGDEVARIPPGQRVLLLPHCLRRADTCQGKYTRQGLDCHECNPECAINRLRAEAVRLGYRGVCVAPGGRLAIRFIEETRPGAIVAVACRKELTEGVAGVGEIAAREKARIPVVVIPLSRDGCVDTEVDVQAALDKIGMGCSSPASRGS